MRYGHWRGKTGTATCWASGAHRHIVVFRLLFAFLRHGRSMPIWQLLAQSLRSKFVATDSAQITTPCQDQFRSNALLSQLPFIHRLESMQPPGGNTSGVSL